MTTENGSIDRPDRAMVPFPWSSQGGAPAHPSLPGETPARCPPCRLPTPRQRRHQAHDDRSWVDRPTRSADGRSPIGVGGRRHRRILRCLSPPTVHPAGAQAEGLATMMAEIRSGDGARPMVAASASPAASSDWRRRPRSVLPRRSREAVSERADRTPPLPPRPIGACAAGAWAAAFAGAPSGARRPAGLFAATAGRARHRPPGLCPPTAPAEIDLARHPLPWR